jgi:hypothetical protein
MMLHVVCPWVSPSCGCEQNRNERLTILTDYRDFLKGWFDWVGDSSVVEVVEVDVEARG